MKKINKFVFAIAGFSAQAMAMGTTTTCTDISGGVSISSWNGMVEDLSLEYFEKETEKTINESSYVFVELVDHKVIWSDSTESGQYDREFSTASKVRLVQYNGFQDRYEGKKGKLLIELGEMSCLSLTNNHE